MTRPDQALRAVPCHSPNDLMIVEKGDNGALRYFRADTAEHEEYSYQRPFILELEITRQCNLNCVHCYAEAESAPPEHELSFDEIRILLSSGHAVGIPELSLTGGEVMLRPDFLDIVDLGISLGYNVRFVTYATLLTDKTLHALAERPIKLITVSLDAISREVHEAIRGTRSHQSAVRAIEKLTEAGFQVSVITAFSKINLSEFDAIFEFCNKLRINWQVQITSAKGRCGRSITLSPDEYYQLGEKTAAAFVDRDKDIEIIPMDDLATFSHFYPLSALSETWQGMCTGGLLNLFVRANGDVTPCSALCFPSCIVGNIRSTSIETVCREALCRQALFPFSKNTRTGICRTCGFLDACNGGCPEILLSMCDSQTENTYCYHRIEQNRILRELF